ncbi:zinc ribbon domain-containing protein [Nitrospirillum sp. BR 11828]|uniref:zinc ribbon domain-containing protein n=1 Tax=Nitrospirillum sp. BR 11828 TaxID=3104325 RepID=UPI002ACA1D12|nr:zinc ribbon domain-containing protein [Nitrospirillum sp. BR 11828]MDZ5647169.1 zinc ribbon domain-containing protein [Nitrospirillum sp. BR 11828]
MFEMLVIAALLGIIPGYIAHSKGRSFFLWWLYGAAIFIVALIHSLLISPNVAEVEQRQLDSGMKKCPHCAELIKADANVCRYCGRDQHGETASVSPA